MMDNNSTRNRNLPPHNIEAEHSVLGALLLDNSAFHRVLELGLSSSDFYRDSHGKIFEAIQSIIDRAGAADLITVGELLKKQSVYDTVGGTDFLTKLFENSYSSAHVVHYAKIVREASIRRQLIRAANTVLENVHTVEGLDDLLDGSESAIFQVTEAKLQKRVLKIGEVMTANLTRFKELAEKKSGITGLSSGFTDLDKLTAGLQPGTLVIIAGRPGMGKTSFALNIAANAALHSRAAVAIFSLEMSAEELGVRLLTSHAKVEATRLKTGQLSELDYRAIAKSAGVLNQTKLLIDESGSLTPMELRSMCRRIMASSGLDLVVVDYIQLMRMGRYMENKAVEVGEISKSLKSLAKELKIPVIALAQLNRKVEERDGDRHPQLNHLKDSGSIEQDADIVMFVHREDYYKRDTEEKGIAEIIVAKHRSGATNSIRLSWRPEFTAFDNLSGHYSAPLVTKPQSSDSTMRAAPVRRGLDLPTY